MKTKVNEELITSKDEGSACCVNKVKITRRTRKVKEGRDFVCQFCHRGYLSIGSVVYHVRLKHMHEREAKAFIISQLKWPRKDKDESLGEKIEELIPQAQLPHDELLEQNHVVGGPVDPLAKFATVVRLLFHQ